MAKRGMMSRLWVLFITSGLALRSDWEELDEARGRRLTGNMQDFKGNSAVHPGPGRLYSIQPYPPFQLSVALLPTCSQALQRALPQQSGDEVLGISWQSVFPLRPDDVIWTKQHTQRRDIITQKLKLSLVGKTQNQRRTFQGIPREAELTDDVSGDIRLDALAHLGLTLCSIQPLLHKVPGGDQAVLGLVQTVSGQLHQLVLNESQDPVSQGQDGA
ncbi:hypothetical protein EYF80_012708 [Liparis tanakae]|uniref:Uncharacterized protein n=1 Tax=Liparis tanakae TaxID=230148 RepID=A0A4Z2IGK1_9TELE|nr:hypothetical protein EYF80_012708 [Liparis tanakae]